MPAGDPAALESRLDEAAARPMVGWDFSWLGDRMAPATPDAHYDEWVQAAIREAPDLLDMGTGGGEWLAGLNDRPSRTVATEGWTPNFEIARRRLGPLGIEVYPVGGGPDNVNQAVGAPIPDAGTSGALPFPDGSFSLIINRHESFVAAEVHRSLAPGGIFITRQIGDGIAVAIRRELGLPPDPPPRAAWTLSLARAQLEAAGFTVEEATEAVRATSFRDAAAFGWYVASVPWYLDGFTVDRYRPELRALQDRVDRGHVIRIPEPVFTIRAPAI
ncbi:MAG TPA: methyltransferase domain-containing protein [Thermomicrobiales bacterium]|nr:methyltransferase domain-containing protein [Thermomicrobiales bacterium]